MMGISWGAFAALQTAARRPESLKAIVIASFTDNRYADDMHYLGGAMLSDNLAEAGTMFAYATCPPDPALVGERWRDMWRERLEAARPWVLEWLRHPRRDAYWQHASLNEDYARLRCPVLASSGWADGYSNAVTRLLANVDVPRKGLIGPWSHTLPHLGEPGPAIGYLQEVVAWWDHWLKGVDNGVMDGPMLRTWMQDSVPPSTSYQERPGRWVAEPSWPSPRVTEVVHPLRGSVIVTADAAEAAPPGRDRTVRSPLSVGQFMRQVGLVQRPARPALRPARGGRRLPGLRDRTARRAPGDPRLALRRPGGLRLRPGRPDHGQDLRRRPRRQRHPGDVRRAEPDPPRERRAPRTTGARPALPGPHPAERGRAGVPARPPRPALPLDLVLAPGVAGAGTRPAHRPRGRRCADSSRTPHRGARRHAPGGLREPEGRPPPSPG